MFNMRIEKRISSILFYCIYLLLTYNLRYKKDLKSMYQLYIRIIKTYLLDIALSSKK